MSGNEDASKRADAIKRVAAAAPARVDTERLLLRPFEMADAADVQQYAGDFDVARMTSTIPHPYEDGMAEEWLATHAGLRERGEELIWAIGRREDGALVGTIGLSVKPELEAAELGYWIGIPFWGNGYATEAARAVVACGFEEAGLHRIFSRHVTHNPASGRVMQKAGMTYEGTLRHVHRRFGGWEDMAFYSILEDEYRGR